MPNSSLSFVNQVRDAKIKVLASLNQGTDEERAEWKKLCQSLKVIVKMFQGGDNNCFEGLTCELVNLLWEYQLTLEGIKQSPFLPAENLQLYTCNVLKSAKLKTLHYFNLEKKVSGPYSTGVREECRNGDEVLHRYLSASCCYLAFTSCVRRLIRLLVLFCVSTLYCLFFLTGIF